MVKIHQSAKFQTISSVRSPAYALKPQLSPVSLSQNSAKIWKINKPWPSHNLSDSEDVALKTATFISQVNMLNNKFSKISSLVRGSLLQTYCCSWYGSQTWDINSKYVRQLSVEWNKAVRRTLHIPYTTHTRLLPLILNTPMLRTSLHGAFAHSSANIFIYSSRVFSGSCESPGFCSAPAITSRFCRHWWLMRPLGGIKPWVTAVEVFVCGLSVWGWCQCSRCGGSEFMGLCHHCECDEGQAKNQGM